MNDEAILDPLIARIEAKIAKVGQELQAKIEVAGHGIERKADLAAKDCGLLFSVLIVMILVVLLRQK